MGIRAEISAMRCHVVAYILDVAIGTTYAWSSAYWHILCPLLWVCKTPQGLQHVQNDSYWTELINITSSHFPFFVLSI